MHMSPKVETTHRFEYRGHSKNVKSDVRNMRKSIIEAKHKAERDLET